MSESIKQVPFPIKGVAQIAWVVKDLDASVKNFHEIFGIGPWHFYTYGKPLCTRMTRHGKPTEYRMRLALSYIGETRIELIEPLEGDTVYQEFIDKHGYGIHHIGIATDNMQRDIAKAADAGIAMTMDGAGFGPDGDGHYAYLDTERLISTTLELIERPKRRKDPEKIYPINI